MINKKQLFYYLFIFVKFDSLTNKKLNKVWMKNRRIVTFFKVWNIIEFY